MLSFFHPQLLEAGLDEAGRGCYAGPVFAAAVVLQKDFYHPLLNDSKLMKEKDRYTLRSVIEKEAIAFAVAQVSPAEIDRINILQASFTAMHQCIDLLSIVPEMLLVDGNLFRPYPTMPHQCIVRGDSLYAPIAAASVLAKTYRDDYMMELHQQHPQYGWLSNKGYGSLYHRSAIEKYGLCQHHRMSFKIKPVL